MKKNLFNLFVFALVSLLFLTYPLSISAATQQRQVAENATPVFKKKLKIKQSFFQRFMQKRIEKALKKQSKRNFEQEQPKQTLGLIAMSFMFVGVLLFLLTLKVGFVFIFIALILSIIALATEENPIYARRAFWVSALLSLYFF
jgi:Flp pilus assembly protein TadB